MRQFWKFLSIKKMFPEGWASKIGVIESNHVRLASPSVQSQIAVLGRVGDNPELVHLVGIIIATGGWVDQFSARSRMRTMFGLRINNSVSPFVLPI